MEPAVREGTYARKQLGSRSRVISWSHSSRFQIGLSLSADLAGKRVLDYGCGDGTYLTLLLESPYPPSRAFGAEIAADLVTGNRERLRRYPNLEFVHIAELSGPEHAGAYEGLVCMEVLEHVLDPDRMLDDFHRLLAPGGTLLISVPVEIGLSVVIKQAIRQVNGWRGIGDYPGTTPYTWGELWTAVFAGARQHVTRPVHRHADGSGFHDHKGFNWRLLRQKMAARFELLETRSSPLSWMPAFVASQIWFRARRRPGPPSPVPAARP